MLFQLLPEAKKRRSPGSRASRATVWLRVPLYWNRDTRGIRLPWER
jgi:hypothetical protein